MLPTFASFREPTPLELAEAEDAGHHSAANSFLKFSRVAKDTGFALEDMPPVAAPDPGTGLAAYFDDPIVAAQTLQQHPDDGDFWEARLIIPGDTPGSTRSFLIDRVNYLVSSPSGANCFVSQGNGNAVCDTTAAVIIWAVGSRCGTAGSWEWRFSYTNAPPGDTVEYATGTHSFEPHVPLWSITNFNQGNYSDPIAHHYANQCDMAGQENTAVCPPGAPTTDHRTIQQDGCMMTAVVDVLNYHDVPVTPVGYNDAARTFLPSSSAMLGYGDTGKINWPFVQELAQVNAVYTVRYRDAFFDTIDINADSDFDGVYEVRRQMDAAICDNGPQIIQLHQEMSGVRPHYAAALGRTLDEPSRWVISDPDGGGASPRTWPDVAYGGRFFEARLPTAEVDFGALFITAYSPVELLLTDSAGRRCGRVPGGPRIEEIPGCRYGVGGGNVPLSEPEKVIEFMRPPADAYRVDIAGTGTGTYDLHVRTGTSDGIPSEWQLADVATSPGTVHSLAIDYSKQPGVTARWTGGFDGGGQRPADVNKFLSYLAPSQSRTSLPAGTTETVVMVAYGRITGGTFQATLEGTDVSGQFHPGANTIEAVRIPLHQGSNVLKLSARGVTASDRDATDTDRLVFLVP